MAIRVLPQTLINQIAAGEVVVNVASVVKELVENSVDAGATQITVELSPEARDVTISDDGCGMDRDDAELSLQRHATSKIATSEDLFNLHTRGFRGEALASIAAVSRLEIRTRRRSDAAGTRVAVEGGSIETIESVGCPVGTRIEVRDLFFNTPARLKFLKSPVAEANAVAITLVRQALAVANVGVRFVRGDRVDMDLPPGQSLADRFLQIMGSRVEHGLLPVEFERDNARVSGYLARPLSSRPDRRSQFLFVNSRPFRSKSISAAVEQACRGFIDAGRFPMFCLFVDVPPEEVDINVHPTKEEVRFRDERALSGAAYHAVRTALEGRGFVPELGPLPDEGNAPAATSVASASEPNRVFQPAFFSSPEALVQRAFDRRQARALQTDWTLEAARAAQTSPAHAVEFAPAKDPGVAPSTPEPPSNGHPEDGFWSQPYEPEPLGQIATTYIAVRYGPDLLLVDQHAAHERLRFLELQRKADRSATQPLLIPSTFDVPLDRRGALEALAPRLEELGFTVEPFGGSTWAVTAVPGEFDGEDAVLMILDLLDEADSIGKVGRYEDWRDRVLARAACHSSIRAGRQLTLEEMRALLAQMRAERLSFTCPHGRPTVVRMGKEHLDRVFHRIT